MLVVWPLWQHLFPSASSHISGVLVSPTEVFFPETSRTFLRFLWSVRLDSTVHGVLRGACAPLLPSVPSPDDNVLAFNMGLQCLRREWMTMP